MADIMGGDSNRKGSRRKKYVPGLACIKFSPDDYWSPDEAQRLYEGSRHPSLDQDTIRFEDCIQGMERMLPNTVDLVVADPPFGIDFRVKKRFITETKIWWWTLTKKLMLTMESSRKDGWHCCTRS